MKNSWFYNSYTFRIAGPLLFGIAIYLLILLFFDSVGMLIDNFFSREVIFVIILSYLFFEVNRLVIVLMNRIYPLHRDIRFRILIQVVISVVLTIIIISSLLSVYFYYIIGFSTIRTELITFNAIFLFVSFFYHLYFFSFVFLNRRNESRIKQELAKKNNLELEMEAFKNQVNPSFLFYSLESIIAALHENKKKADDLVENLAQLYRYMLDNQHNELVTIKMEMDSLSTVVPLFKQQYGNAFQLKISNRKNTEKQIIPGTIHILLENAVFSNIISTSLPLSIEIKVEHEQVVFIYTTHPSLTHINENDNRLKRLIKAYEYYSDSGIQFLEEEKLKTVIIPLITLEEE